MTTMETPPGNLNEEAYINALEELRVLSPDYRANVPAGTVLGRDEFGDGGAVTHTKRQSMVRAGGLSLPDRVMLWNKVAGTCSPVPPTIAQKRLLQGTKHFPPSAFTLRDPGLPQRKPIPETCEVCDKRRAEVGNPPRRFFDILQYEAHMEILHPRFWASRQRQEAQSERMEDRQQMRDLISEIVHALRPDMAIGADEDEITEQVAGEVERRRGRRR